MTEFLIYQGKAAIALAVFYMFYRLLLSKETFHRFNRIVLLGTAALSFVLPLCVITFKEVVVVPAMTASSETFTGEVAGTAAMVPEVSEPIWPVILCSLFALGAMAVLVHVVFSIIGIRRMIRSGRSEALESGETLIITETDTAPFSWMKYIVISREDYESGYSHILTHEKAHIALRHSWDILFVDMITALQWFNPAIWMLKADLRALHEFEADDAVLKSGANIKEYQYLLIRKAVSKSGYSVANSFNHSTLKARITMMLNQKSSRMSAWKALYVIPLVGISLAATAETKVDYRYEDQQPVAVADTLESKDSENWYKVEHKDTISPSERPIPEPKSEFTKKNLREGRFIVDKENNNFTLHYFDADCKEVQVHYTGLDLNQNIYMHNGAIVTQDMMMKAAKEDPDAVIIVAYLKDNNRIRSAITTTGPYVTGTINVNEEKEGFTLKSSIQVRTADGEEGEVDANDLVIVVNGERMPDGFDLNTIEPNTITSIEVLKKEKAMEEYGTDKGVIVITTDPSKANEKKPAPDIYIDGKKATSEEVAALPANPKGYIEPDGTVQLITEEKSAEKKEPVPFQHLGQQPTFNGGNANEFSKWVAANMKYPEKCHQSKIQGRVTLQFIISVTGEVTDVKVLRGVHEELDKEALRVVSASPRWTPGKDKNGNIVPVSFTFPVLFQLTDSK